MTEIEKLLDEAEMVINGECDCNTPEYRALDALHRAVKEIVSRQQKQHESLQSVFRSLSKISQIMEDMKQLHRKSLDMASLYRAEGVIPGNLDETA